MGTMTLPRASGLFTVDSYHSFLETRPDDERWQLIDGVAVMMTPPTLVHQRISMNLCRLLNDVFEIKRPEFSALNEVGLIVPRYDGFRPKADAAVLDDTVQDTSYANRFYMAVEIKSDTNTDKHIALKRERYQQHPDNLYVLIIERLSYRLELTARSTGWQSVLLVGHDTVLDLPEFSFSCRLADLYRGTPLAQSVGSVP